MIVDFRCRPPYDESCKYMVDNKISQCYKKFNGNIPMARSAREHNMELFWQEMEEAGIDKIVVQGRKGFEDPTMPASGDANNLAVVDLVNKAPEKVIGIWGIDPADGEINFEKIQQYVIEGPCTGVMIEPGLSAKPVAVDDPSLFPLYQFLQDNKVPLLLASGDLNFRALRLMKPEGFDNICEMFNDLHIIGYHGGWPHTTELQWICLNRENFWLSPDVFMLNTYPGYQDYITGANYLLQDKMIFGSAYPLCDMLTMKNFYDKVLNPDVYKKVMGYNALRALNLEVPEDDEVEYMDMGYRPPLTEEESGLRASYKIEIK